MDKEIRKEIIEMIDYVLGRSDIKKSMKGKVALGSDNDINNELKNIKSDSVKAMLLKLKEENDKNRNEELVKKYGRVLLKEGIYKKIIGKQIVCILIYKKC